MPETEFVATIDAARVADPKTREQLFTILYYELRQMARRELRRGAFVSISPTTLLHETFMNMSLRKDVQFCDQRQFMAYACRAMRGLIIDHLRSRHAQKRGGPFAMTSLLTDMALFEDSSPSLQAEKLNEALDSLTRIEPALAECVDLKFFCGFSFVEIARFRDVSERTVRRDWDKARLLLTRLINEGESGLRATA
jgi:RNA polymerase sigma factor (TIGR02999 family)